MSSEILSAKPRILKKTLGNNKLYVLSIIVNSPLEEEELTELAESFINSIPHTDYSYNLQYADHKKIHDNNRRAKINV